MYTYTRDGKSWISTGTRAYPIIAGGDGEPVVPTGTPPTPKMVPESDLMAVKSQASEWKTKHDSLTTQYDAAFQELNQLKARHQQTSQELEAARSLQTRVTELEGKLAASETSRGDLEKRFLDTRRSSLVERFGLKPEDVVTYDTPEKLDLVEGALSKINPRAGNKPGYDLGGNGGGLDHSSLSAMDKIRQGLELRTK